MRQRFIRGLPLLTVVGLAWLGLASVPGVAAINTSFSASTEIVFSLVGAINPNSSEMRIMNITLWNEYPASFSDTVYYDVATFLNDVLSGTTPPPSPGGRRGDSGNATNTEEATKPMEWYWILLISLGGAGLLAAVITAVYFGVRVNNQVHPKDAPLLPDAPPDAYRIARFVGLPAACYPPPHAYSKVIQVPLVRPRAPSPVYRGGGEACI